MSTTHQIKPIFQSWTAEMAIHNGRAFTITAMVWALPEDHGGDEAEPRFKIQFADGAKEEIEAHAEEIFYGWMDNDTWIERAKLPPNLQR